MKNLILVLVFLLGFMSNAQSNFTLVNKNKKTRGITKMNFHKDARGDFYVRIYASCRPKDCGWGRFRVRQNKGYKEQLTRTNRKWLNYYMPIKVKESFVTRTVTVYQNSDPQIRSRKVIVKSDYYNKKRSDRVHTYLMKFN